MAAQSFQPIETEAGIFKGRDAIFLDELKFDGTYLNLQGELSGKLSSLPTNFWIKFTLVFYGCLAFKVTHIDLCDFNWESSFDQVLDSDWITTLEDKTSPKVKHFLVVTYDEVIEVACRNYQLTLGDRTPYPAK
jgi:hypothetical protein